MVSTTKEQLTPKQERFCLNLFQGMSQREAYTAAGYSPRQSLTTIDHHAYELASNGKILARYEELKKEAASKAVMSERERQERLSSIARADLTDFIEDGKPTLNENTPNTEALSEFSIKEGFSKDGEPWQHKTVKLINPITAIAELNKMTGAYAPEQVEHTGPGGGPLQIVGFQLVPTAPVPALQEVGDDK